MTERTIHLIETLGFLRLALIILTFVNLLIPIVDSQLVTDAGSGGRHSLWNIVATYIAPVMTPLLVVVILFDYIMSRVRAADSESEERSQYIFIGRIELAVIAITLFYWIPYFIALMS